MLALVYNKISTALTLDAENKYEDAFEQYLLSIQTISILLVKHILIDTPFIEEEIKKEAPKVFACARQSLDRAEHILNNYLIHSRKPRARQQQDNNNNNADLNFEATTVATIPTRAGKDEDGFAVVSPQSPPLQQRGLSMTNHHHHHHHSPPAASAIMDSRGSVPITSSSPTHSPLPPLPSHHHHNRSKPTQLPPVPQLQVFRGSTATSGGIGGGGGGISLIQPSPRVNNNTTTTNVSNMNTINNYNTTTATTTANSSNINTPRTTTTTTPSIQKEKELKNLNAQLEQYMQLNAKLMTQMNDTSQSAARRLSAARASYEVNARLKELIGEAEAVQKQIEDGSATAAAATTTPSSFKKKPSWNMIKIERKISSSSRKSKSDWTKFIFNNFNYIHMDKVWKDEDTQWAMKLDQAIADVREQQQQQQQLLEHNKNIEALVQGHVSKMLRNKDHALHKLVVLSFKTKLMQKHSGTPSPRGGSAPSGSGGGGGAGGITTPRGPGPAAGPEMSNNSISNAAMIKRTDVSSGGAEHGSDDAGVVALPLTPALFDDIAAFIKKLVVQLESQFPVLDSSDAAEKALIEELCRFVFVSLAQDPVDIGGLLHLHQYQHKQKQQQQHHYKYRIDILQQQRSSNNNNGDVYLELAIARAVDKVKNSKAIRRNQKARQQREKKQLKAAIAAAAASKNQSQQQQQQQQQLAKPSILINAAMFDIPYSELKITQKIAEGAYGVVYKGKWRKETVAIKKFGVMLLGDATAEEQQRFIKEFENEVSIISQLRHKNILNFMGACTQAPDFALVTEFIDSGSLHQCIHVQKRKLSWEQKLSIMCQIAHGMAFLHERDISHRDLKCQNVLLDATLTPKICDFGLAKSRSALESQKTRMTQSVGTPTHMAPEVVSGGAYGTQCDVFSFAIIMWEILFEKLPYSDMGRIPMVHIKVATDPRFRPTIPKEYEVLLSSSEDEAQQATLFSEEDENNHNNSNNNGHGVQGEEKEGSNNQDTVLSPSSSSPMSRSIPSPSQIEFVRLMKMCWRHDPEQRPTMDDVVDALENLSEEFQN